MDDGWERTYRGALGAFATGVAIVLAPDGEHSAALTVNSFTSVSLDPPLVLWSLGQASDRGVWFMKAERFTLNILGADDEALARACARRGHYRLDPSRVDASREGSPAVAGALATLYCEVHEHITLGDHIVFVGRVTDFTSRDGDGLTYFRGRYGRASLPEDKA